MSKTKFISTAILLSFLLIPLFELHASTADDASAYEKFPLYSKYQKKKKYGEYKKLQKVKLQLGFDDAKTKQAAKDGYTNYKLYLKDKTKYRSFAKYLPQYNAYKKYQKYSAASKYKKYKNYDKKEYDKYKKYGSRAYEDGYNRYRVFMNDINNVTANRGPQINIGLWSVTKDNLGGGSSDTFMVAGNKQFNVTDCSGTIFGNIPVGASAQTTYIAGSGGHMAVSNDTGTVLSADGGEQICYEPTDGNVEDMIFNIDKPDSSFDHYRGKIKIDHTCTSTDPGDGSCTAREIWIVNMLPLELYVWGFGEIGGGVEQHSLAMIVTARTYARWYLQPTVAGSKSKGFDILATAGSQIYYGYDYEKDHTSIAELARRTNGVIMKNQEGDIAFTPYCSWSDGQTRKHENGNWSKIYREPTAGNVSASYSELSVVADPYGKHPYLTGKQLAEGCTACVNGQDYNGGNHMVGLIANGSLNLALNYSWGWTRILPYYYSGISIVKIY